MKDIWEGLEWLRKLQVRQELKQSIAFFISACDQQLKMLNPKE